MNVKMSWLLNDHLPKASDYQLSQESSGPCLPTHEKNSHALEHLRGSLRNKNEFISGDSEKENFGHQLKVAIDL